MNEKKSLKTLYFELSSSKMLDGRTCKVLRKYLTNFSCLFSIRDGSKLLTSIID